MKTKIALLAMSLMAAFSLARAESPAAQPAVVKIDFVSPEDFTDVKDSHLASDRGRDAILEELKDYVQTQATKRLPAGHTFAVQFKDIDLAGDYEPWRVQAMDVRIVKDIYPPRIKLSFKQTDASGAVVREGDRNLVDLAFMSRLTMNRSDELKYEKALLADWLQEELPKPKKS